MNLTRSAALLGVSPKTLRLAAEQREIEAAHPLADGPWLFRRSTLQSEAATRLVERVRNRRSAPRGTCDAATRPILINDIARCAV